MSLAEIVLDIETVADVSPEVRAALVARIKPRANLTDPYKIRQDVAEKEAAIDEKAALSPATGRVVAVGLAIRPPGDVWHEHVVTCWPDDPQSVPRFTSDISPEALILRAVGNLLWPHHEATFVTFCGRTFDLPFLQARIARHQLAENFRYSLTTRGRGLDLFDVLGQEYGLDIWARALLGRGKLASGEKVAGIVADKRWDWLRAYCLDDVRITREIYERLGGAMLLRS